MLSGVGLMKNRDQVMKMKCENYVPDWIGQVPGKRESRRIIGQHFINEHELSIDHHYPDEVAFGGWFLDLHTPGGLLAKNSEAMAAEGYSNTIERSKGHVGPYGLPLRALISKDIVNLGMAGRNISTSKAALGSLRVMNTTALLGQAIGTAAAQAKRVNSDLAEVSLQPQSVKEIQQRLLREACFLPHVAHEDESDLIQQAELHTSSTLINQAHSRDEDKLSAPSVAIETLPHSIPNNTAPENMVEPILAQTLAVDGGPLSSLQVCLSNPTSETVTSKLAYAKSVICGTKSASRGRSSLKQHCRYHLVKNNGSHGR